MGHPLTVASVLLAALGLAGCGQSTIDSGKTAEFVRSHYTGPESLKTVDCPKGVASKKGTNFDCKLTGVKGDHAIVTVHITNDSGRVIIGPGVGGHQYREEPRIVHADQARREMGLSARSPPRL